MRGLLAFGVMAYHLLGWSGTARILTLGTYFVYAFFVLSGFALEWAYASRVRSGADIRRYAAARVGRILPLYAGVTLAAAILLLVAGRSIDVTNVALNLTLTFGFFEPGATSTVTGGWSIGVEVVFYLLFPVIVWLGLSTRSLVVLATAMLALRAAILWSAWPEGALLTDVWVEYTRVPAFLWFFVAGMAGARLVAARDVRAGWPPPGHRLAGAAPLAAGAVIMLLVVAASLLQDERALFAGPIGILLSLGVAVAVVVVGFAPPWHGNPARVATTLGDMSYGTYLLHPLVWIVLGRLDIRGGVALLLTIVLAPLLALVVHRFIELPAGRAVRTALAPRKPSAPAALPALSE